ncbi:hypothetical protein Q9Q94_11140 [Uliginosibacterium sp. 31-16]|uniref:hypothetical protein n=1 Tax=Uliginosibacterium sp. 31-16 TaxID=3068315 RepID=UPI00273E7016|nr:hypothetical protein [Uliginosibacterium sp. 31-16]MDP5240089.1 hypothetical protein [Uliginosibacterium sp. 31-16]
MAGHWTDTCSFVDAAITDKGVVCAAISIDELSKDQIEYTKMAALFPEDIGDISEWSDLGEARWDSIGAGFFTSPDRFFAIVGATGSAYTTNGEEPNEAKIKEGSDYASEIGLLRGIRNIGGSLYACGMHGQIWKLGAGNNWSFMTKSLPRKNGFESLDGFNENEIYAAGWEGEIWQFDGQRWIQHDSGTNVILVDIICAGDGQVYAVGRGGMLVHGRGAAWETIKLNLSVELWSLAWFKGELYACSTRDIFKWDGETFVPMKIEGDRPNTLQYLNVSTHGEELCVVGPKDLFRFDGTTWTRID